MRAIAERRLGAYPPIRVLHVLPRSSRGDADATPRSIVRGLDPRRYEVDLAVADDRERCDLDGVDVHVIPELVRDPSPIQDLVALVKLSGLIRRRRYQIVHAHAPKGGFLARVAAAMVGAPIIVHAAPGATFDACLSPGSRRFYRALERIAASLTHQYVAVARHAERGDEGETEPAFETIYSGMPLREYLEAGRMTDAERDALRRELGFRPEHRVVVMAAALEERKGHRYLFEAVQRLASSHAGLRLLVLGDGPLLAALQQRCRELGIASIVRFVGHRHDLARVLAASDVSVLTSLWDGLPRVLVQSAALGRPIVPLDVEDAWDAVREERNGYVVPTDDVDAFALRLDTAVRGRGGAPGDARREPEGGGWTVETLLERRGDPHPRPGSRDVA